MDATYLFVGKFLVWGVGAVVLAGLLAWAANHVAWKLFDRLIGFERLAALRDEMLDYEDLVEMAALVRGFQTDHDSLMDQKTDIELRGKRELAEGRLDAMLERAKRAIRKSKRKEPSHD